MENITLVLLSAAEIRTIFNEEFKNVLENLNLNGLKREGQDEILNFEQTCRFLNIPVSTLYYYTSKNMVPHSKRGKKLFFVKADLIEWIKEGKKGHHTGKEDLFLIKLRKKGKIKNKS